MYVITTKSADFNDDFLQYLVATVGNRVGTVSLCADQDDKFLAFASNQPGRMLFKELIISTSEFSSNSG